MNPIAAPVVLAGPITEWLDNQVTFFRNLLPLAMLVVIMSVGAYLLITGKGGLKTVLGFGIGGVLVYMLLVNVEEFADMFQDEIDDVDPAQDGEQYIRLLGTGLRLAGTVARAAVGA